MGIASDAEKIDTPESYREMYKKYSALTYGEVLNLLRDFYGAIETKLLLGEDSASLSTSNLRSLLSEVKKLGNLASRCDAVLKLKIESQKNMEMLTSRE